MSKPVLAIDVDETVVSALHDWNKWSIDNLGYSLDFTKEVSDKRAEEFWKQDDLYDDKEPFEEAKKVIDDLYNYFTIIFVSHSFNEHLNSKKKFLDRNFKYSKFISTSEKHLVDCDFIIDDREVFLKPFKDNNHKAITILLKREFKSTGISDFHMDWPEIHKFLLSKV